MSFWHKSKLKTISGFEVISICLSENFQVPESLEGSETRKKQNLYFFTVSMVII